MSLRPALHSMPTHMPSETASALQVPAPKPMQSCNLHVAPHEASLSATATETAQHSQLDGLFYGRLFTKTVHPAHITHKKE